MMNIEGGQGSSGHDHGIESGTHVMIGVSGNYAMCKDRIEEAANRVKGVLIATWDTDAKELHLEYDSEVVNTEEVEKAIAAVGHDTENFTAPDDVYSELHACCLYR